MGMNDQFDMKWFERLKVENYKLTERKKELEKEADELRTRIASLVADQVVIRESNVALRRENEELKKEIKELREQIEWESRFP